MSTNGKSLSLKEILKAAGARTWKEAVVRLGYADVFGLEDHMFDFLVRLSDPEEAARIISEIGVYNNFDGEAVAEFVGSLMHSKVIMYVEFGRRGSPELHVYVRDPETQKDVVREALERLGPDELEDFGPYGLRAWWD